MFVCVYVFGSFQGFSTMAVFIRWRPGKAHAVSGPCARDAVRYLEQSVPLLLTFPPPRGTLLAADSLQLVSLSSVSL